MTRPLSFNEAGDEDRAQPESLEDMLSAMLDDAAEAKFYKDFMDPPPPPPPKKGHAPPPLSDSEDESLEDPGPGDGVEEPEEPPPPPLPPPAAAEADRDSVSQIRELLKLPNLYEIGKWVYRAAGRVRLGSITMPMHWSHFYLVVKCNQHAHTGCEFAIRCPPGARYVALYEAILRFLMMECTAAAHAEAIGALKAEWGVAPHHPAPGPPAPAVVHVLPGE